MIDYESQTDEELNQFAVERLNPTVGGYDASDWPDYLRSLDACFSDYVPILRRKNHQIDLSFWTGLHKWIWTCDIADGDYSAYDPNPARAFTVAFLMATGSGEW